MESSSSCLGCTYEIQKHSLCNWILFMSSVTCHDWHILGRDDKAARHPCSNPSSPGTQTRKRKMVETNT